jgi:ribosomal protein S18 acetylase RimI-like enzyme
MSDQIEVLDEVNEADAQAVSALMGQLSTRDPGDVEGKLKAIVQATDADIIAVRDEGRIVGVVVINVIHKVLGREGRIDEIVVDESMRGRGLATKLMDKAAHELRDRGCTMVELTSSARREGANKLYKSLGYELRETNVYRLKL